MIGHEALMSIPVDELVLVSGGQHGGKLADATHIESIERFVLRAKDKRWVRDIIILADGIIEHELVVKAQHNLYPTRLMWS